MANLLVPGTESAFDNGVWNNFHSTFVTPNTDLAFDGSMTADTLTDSDGSNGQSQAQGAVIPANTLPYVAYVKVKKTVGAVTFPLIDIRFGNYFSPSAFGGMVVDTNTGNFVARSGWVPNAGYGVVSRGNYWLAWVAHKNVNDTQVNIGVAPAIATDLSGGVSISVTGSAVFCDAGLEQGVVPPTVVTWDPVNKSASTTLSLSNLESNVSGGGGVIATLGHDVTDPNGFYWEVTFNSSDDGFLSHYLGAALAGWDTSDNGVTPGHSLGYDANGWGVSTNQESYSASLHNNTLGDINNINNLDPGLYGSSMFGRTFGFLLKAGTLSVINLTTGAHLGSTLQAFHGLTGTLFAAIGSVPTTARRVSFTTNFGETPFVATTQGVYPTGAHPYNLAVVPSDRATYFEAVNLPTGLHLDSNGRIFGVPLCAPGVYNVTIRAINAAGQDEKTLVITISETVAPTDFIEIDLDTFMLAAATTFSIDVAVGALDYNGAGPRFTLQDGAEILAGHLTIPFHLDFYLSKELFGLASNSYYAYGDIVATRYPGGTTPGTLTPGPSWQVNTNSIMVPAGKKVARLNIGGTGLPTWASSFPSADDHPSSPSAYDDEFDDFSLDPAWTTYNGADLTVAESDTYVMLSRPGRSGGVTSQAGIERALPAGPWTIIARMASQPQSSDGNATPENFVSHALGFRGTTHRNVSIGLVYSSGQGGWGYQGGVCSDYEGVSVFEGTAGIPFVTWPHGSAYFKVQYDGTNLIFSISERGESWTLAGSVVAASYCAGGVPLMAMLNCQPGNTSTGNRVCVDWFRLTTP